MKQTKETEVTKRKSCETSRSTKERRSGYKERKPRICTVYYSKVIRMLEQNDVEQYFIHAYAEKLKIKFENATMITEEEVIRYILEDMKSHFNTENVFEKKYKQLH